MVCAVFCLAMVWGLACQSRKDVIKIGLSVNLSGPGGAAGEHIRDGAIQAVEDINAQGGVNGRPLRLLVRDDQSTAEGIRLADESLIKEKVAVIIGHSQSSNTLISYPFVTAHNIVLMTGFTSATALSGRDDLFVRTSVDCNLYGEKTAILLKKKGFNRVAFLLDMSNAAFGNDWMEQTRHHFPGEMNVVRLDSSKTLDWNGIIAELLGSGPEVIVLLTSSSTTAVAAQFLRRQGTSIPLMASLWSQSPELVNVGGNAVEGMTLISFIPSENSRPDYLSFSQRLEKNFNKKATPRSARAHEIIFILADALKRCKAINGPELKTALLAGEYQTILGTVRFNAFGDTIRPVYEERVVNGAFKTIGQIK